MQMLRSLSSWAYKRATCQGCSRGSYMFCLPQQTLAACLTRGCCGAMAQLALHAEPLLPALRGGRPVCLFTELLLSALQEAVEWTVHACLLTADLALMFLQDVVAEATQRMLELHEGWKQVRAHPIKKQSCACCSVQ